MEWLQCRLYTTHAGLEPVYAALMSAGVSGLQIEDDEDLFNFLENEGKSWDYVDLSLANKPPKETRVTFYLSGDVHGRETLLAVKERVAGLKSSGSGLDLGRLFLETEQVDDEGWLNAWKKYYKPFRLGQRIIIKPEWEPFCPESGDVVVRMNPGGAFGTGLHQSTRLCALELEKRVTPGCTVLDIGCGSGILSVIALLLSAGRVVAVDIDGNAVGTAKENAGLNNVIDRFEAIHGDVLGDRQLMQSFQGFDIVVANIVADVIINLSGQAFDSLKQGGVFIASGIIDERLEDVLSAAKQAGFTELAAAEEEGWASVVGVKG